MVERKKLLPKWIRFFCWIFIIFLGAPIILFVGLFVGNMRYNLYGVAYYGPVLSPLPIAMTIVLMVHGITAYGLLWGRRWALDMGILCGVIGTMFALAGMAIAHTRGQMHFEFSIIGQVPFLLTLFNVRRKWLEV
ncbi:hypothetical protein [Oryzomonas rubra]|uniref:Uncharacterized protein n=1 Tax=Oryzomonas rubra TaxID=2509454 RepID=A0A5A9X9K0_9BACT|nr:hypothetical protein [Oryzomonas rubra]KAA0889128.1 hypothetical protein ET418_14895 [Oryzomonas rubra]